MNRAVAPKTKIGMLYERASVAACTPQRQTTLMARTVVYSSGPFEISLK
jgi:hypothetical protein